MVQGERTHLSEKNIDVVLNIIDGSMVKESQNTYRRVKLDTLSVETLRSST